MPLLRLALEEDIGPGDVTSEALIPAGARADAAFVAREPMVLCGLGVAEQVFGLLDAGINCEKLAEDGQRIAPGQTIMRVRGLARAVLTGERTALNLLQRMCGVASLTRRYVDAIAGTGCVLLDTRKTIPGWRLLDKYATRVGGAQNHRMGLYDMVLIKDNHIALFGGVGAAVAQARKHAAAGIRVEVECDTLEQLREALEAGPDVIMLDNMSVAQLREAVGMAGGRVPLEASGGVSLETIRAMAETGVDYISVGRVTHSAVAVDIGLDVVVG